MELTKNITYRNGKPAVLYVTMTYDDECGNGHKTFAITGTVMQGHYRLECGCIHDTIAKYMPELAKYTKWHLMSEDGPLHYIADTLYFSKEVTHPGLKAGDPVKFETRFKFSGVPFTYAFSSFLSWVWDIEDFSNLEVESIPYDGTSDYTGFTYNYSFTGFIDPTEAKKWYKAPFHNYREACEFLQACKDFRMEKVKTPIKYCESVEPDLEAARKAAIWPDATLEQLQDEQLLKDRLPALLAEFNQAMGDIFNEDMD